MPPVKPTSTAALKPKAPQTRVPGVDPRPTPTQEESNLAAAGVHLETHAWDGTPLQNPHGTPPPDRPELPPGTLPPPTVAPVLNTLTPNNAVVGGNDVTMTVNGTGFTPNSVIVWNGGDEPTTFISATQVSTVVKPSTASGAFTIPITVRNGDKISNTLTFQFTEAAK